jgi:HPt (histidine-containing phosphotransfer) domain-containing protein
MADSANKNAEYDRRLPAGNLPCGSKDNESVVAFTMLERNLGKEAALEVLSSFIGFAKESLFELRASIQSTNVKQARVLAHELSHSCKVIGASSLLRTCVQLEEELKDPDWQRVTEQVSGVAIEMRAVAKCLSQLLS